MPARFGLRSRPSHATEVGEGDSMAFPIHELAALGTATCWATTGIIASDAIRALGAFHFNLIRQVFVSLILAGVVLASGMLALPGWQSVAVLAVSGVVGILLGDTLNFAAVGRLGPRRAGAVFALNAPMAAVLGWLVLDEALGGQAWAGIALTVAGVALAIMGRPASGAVATSWRRRPAACGLRQFRHRAGQQHAGMRRADAESLRSLAIEWPEARP